jgi:tRNA A37 methylthiotransferase MiaB
MNKSIVSILYSPIAYRRNQVLLLCRLSTQAFNSEVSSKKLDQVPSLKEFMLLQNQAKASEQTTSCEVSLPSPSSFLNSSRPMNFYIETYGCQMNISDSEIVRSVLLSSGYHSTSSIEEADIILTNTCAVRENAELKVKHRLKYFQSLRKKNRISKRQQKANSSSLKEETADTDIKTYLSNHSIYPLVGVLGCMAERIKDKLLLEDSVDFICGPDSYRDIPRLLNNIITLGEKQSNTALSYQETYSDIAPVREENSVSAYVSIMRGCNNMCSFCIVPFTRGRERSRPFLTILQEIRSLVEQGVKEIVLLGQNVNGYHDTASDSLSYLSSHSHLFSSSSPTSGVVSSTVVDDILESSEYKATPGFNNLYQSKKKDKAGIRFSHLLVIVAQLFPEVRIRFTSPHPKDFPEEVLDVIASHYNICSNVHLPLQSGSTSVLERMRRGYSQDAYLSLAKRIRQKIPGVTLSTDIITGFCDESEEEHQETLKLLKEVQYEQAFMFAYSKREKTHAYYHYEDNITEDIKQRRLTEIIDTFRDNMIERNIQEENGNYQVVLVEGESMRSTSNNITFTGRTDGNKRVIFPATSVPSISLEQLQSYWKEMKHLRKDSSSQLKSINDESSLSLKELLFDDIIKWSPELREELLVQGISSSNLRETMKTVVSVDQLPGEYVLVKILKANTPTLRGVAVARTTIADMNAFSQSLRHDQ